MDRITNIDKVERLLDKQLTAIGKDKALTILLNQSANYRKTFQNKDVINVIKVICSEFNYTYDELVHSQDRTWQRVWAMKFCCYYLLSVKNVTPFIARYVLNRSKSLVHRYAKEVLETDDKIVIKLRNSFDKKIK